MTYRLPISLVKGNGNTHFRPSSGGLATAMGAFTQKAKQDILWIGVADFSRNDWVRHSADLSGDFAIQPVFLPQQLNKEFYHGFSNSVLWPLFHYFPSFVEYKDTYLKAYCKANECIARTVLEHYEEGDLIWVHDYHLFPLPQLIRNQRPNAQIGFFLHIPFPQYEVFRLLPEKAKTTLLTHVLGADLVGFHTRDYARSFTRNVEQVLGLTEQEGSIRLAKHTCKVGAFPISIDFQQFNKAYGAPEVAAERKRIRATHDDCKVVFSVDRLDYTKGVMHRLSGFDHFLKKYPQWKEKVVFIIVVVPSRDGINKYWERKELIEAHIGKIIGRHGNYTWTPVRYQYQSLGFDQLIALYTSADVALITPVRDGMNLVSKEFVASRKDQRGVLILSELTGAASELSGALLINPLDADQIADRLHDALNMPQEEQRSRMRDMQAHLRKHDVFRWASGFRAALDRAYKPNQFPVSLKGDHLNELLEQYTHARNRLILLDYDGTLAGFKPKPELAFPTAGVRATLQRLAANPQNRVAIFSGRDRDTLEQWLGDLDIDLVAEHGAFVKQGEWMARVAGPDAWKADAMAILQEYTSIYAASFIEVKTYALAWHYRNVDPEKGFAASRALIRHLRQVFPASTYTVLDGNKVVELKLSHVSKGQIFQAVYAQEPYDFVLAIGDDATDEDLFQVLDLPHHNAIKVGGHPTAARYRIPNVPQVLALLDRLN